MQGQVLQGQALSKYCYCYTGGGDAEIGLQGVHSYFEEDRREKR